MSLDNISNFNLMKQVSAIITTHNRADLLKRAIESVFNQTYELIECIVVDDNSTDNTREICGQFPIRYIYIPKEDSHGGNYARNIGIKASTGDYCAFLDDDDYWLPTKLEKQMALMEQHDCEFVHCLRRKEIITPEGIVYQDTLMNPNLWGDMHKKILQNICTTTSNILVSRKALIEVGLFDENLGFWQEYELTIRLAQRKPFYLVDEPLTVYRVDTHDTKRLTNKYYEWKRAVNYIHKKHANLYSQLNFIEKYRMRNLVWRDAVMRCKSSGLYWLYLFYKILTLPPRIFSLIKRNIKKLYSELHK